jgi:manganese/zinc/iron transport system permease protein
MVMLAALFGLLAGVSGSVISSTAQNLPTGPMIVLCVSTLVALSFLIAPNRGLAWRAVRDWRNSRRLRLDTVLLDLYMLADQHEEREHPHSEAILDVMHEGTGRTRRTLKVLAERGLATHVEGSGWVLTPEGAARAREVYRSRFPGAEL